MDAGVHELVDVLDGLVRRGAGEHVLHEHDARVQLREGRAVRGERRGGVLAIDRVVAHGAVKCLVGGFLGLVRAFGEVLIAYRGGEMADRTEGADRRLSLSGRGEGRDGDQSRRQGGGDSRDNGRESARREQGRRQAYLIKRKPRR